MNAKKRFQIENLPSELQNKICSYLYFSNNISGKIKQVNETIKNYRSIHLASLSCDHETDLELVSYFILKFFLYDKNRSDKLQLDYNMLSNSRKLQHDELERIFTSLRLVDILRILKYIQQNGVTSEFYDDQFFIQINPIIFILTVRDAVLINSPTFFFTSFLRVEQLTFFCFINSKKFVLPSNNPSLSSFSKYI